MDVVLRADAGVNIGGGHVMRCLTLAQALERQGADVAFACRTGTEQVVSRLAERTWRELPQGLAPEQEAQYLADGWPEGCELLVVDHYGLDARFERACRGWAQRILVIDDLADRSHDAEWLLDQTPGREAQDYAGRVNPECRLLLGADHLLLRPAFASARHAARSRRLAGGRSGRLLVTLGLTDAHNVTARILEGIAAAGVAAEVDVVLGGGAPHLDAVRALTRGMPFPVTLHVDVSRMERLMAQADLAIGAGGTSAWERCCLGLPAITVTIADNQFGVARVLEEAGASLTAAPGEVAARLADLWEDDARLARMGVNAASLCDGLGAPRTAMLLRPGRAADGRPVRLRPATLNDARLVWTWQQEPGIRRHARQPRPPAWEEHLAWMTDRLADPGTLFHLILHGEEPAGLLRFDRLPDGRYEVSILVATASQRLGLAAEAVRLGRFLLPEATLLAWIKPENSASLALFAKAGYRRLDAHRFILEPTEVQEAE
ncbi:MAG: UDP-2,4-diacetamido-2,4,6-trideoxy-beta-L-altropyranose hydrolase [Magnetococcales bacterium]|nr:UDP-2,4-diacetamido-2,4,6-trideoxy-beta-L-altropyranose hydrolase [Magnetococcales bacterium]